MVWAGGTFRESSLEESKGVIGSKPPVCANKCMKCRPCMATVVVPDHQRKQGSFKLVSSRGGEDDDSYYLLSWKCRCGNKLFQPWSSLLILFLHLFIWSFSICLFLSLVMTNIHFRYRIVLAMCELNMLNFFFLLLYGYDLIKLPVMITFEQLSISNVHLTFLFHFISFCLLHWSFSYDIYLSLIFLLFLFLSV